MNRKYRRAFAAYHRALIAGSLSALWLYRKAHYIAKRHYTRLYAIDNPAFEGYTPFGDE